MKCDYMELNTIQALAIILLSQIKTAVYVCDWKCSAFGPIVSQFPAHAVLAY